MGACSDCKLQPTIDIVSDALSPLTRAHRLSRWLAWAGGGALIAASLLVSADVVCRKLFNVSMGGADEVSGYVFGAATALSMAYALLERAHIRIDILHRFLPRPLRLAADVVGLLLLFGFIALVCRMAGEFYLDTLRHGSRSITPLRAPLAIPQTFWFAGWLLAACACLLLLCALLSLIIRGNFHAASELTRARGDETERRGEDNI